LDRHNENALAWCTARSVENDGFTCSNYLLSNVKPTLIDDKEAYLLEEVWTRTENDKSSEVHLHNLQVFDGNDIWTVLAESVKDELNESDNFLIKIIDSFALLQNTSQEMQDTQSNGKEDYNISKFFGKGPVDDSDPNWPGKIIRTAIKGDNGVVIAATAEGIKLVRFEVTTAHQCQDAQNSICIEAIVSALKNTEHPGIGDDMNISIDLDTKTQVISMVSGMMEGTNTIIHLQKMILEN
jgi:hypothetical protein